MNSIETVEFYFNTPESDRRIDTNFGDSQMYDMLIEAQNCGVSVQNIFGESVGGYLDFKLKLDKGTIYNINGIYYDANETGNYMWSFLLRINNNPKSLDGILAQGGSIISKNSRLDESWDRRARKAGEATANQYRKLAKIFGVVEVLNALKIYGNIDKKDLKEKMESKTNKEDL